MSKQEKIQNLTRLILPFFETKNLEIANDIREKIYNDVRNRNYPGANKSLIYDSMEIFSQDINSYLTTLANRTPDRLMKHQAFLALKGIIVLIELSEEP